MGKNIQIWRSDESPDFLVVNLGQVDVELGLPFRQFVQGLSETPGYWIDYFVEKYFEYLNSIELGKTKLIVKGINLPVLCYDWKKSIKYIIRIVTERFTDSSEGAQRREFVMKNLNDSYLSDIQRSDLAREFNSKVAAKCKENEFAYFDINDKLVNRLFRFQSVNAV